jgi:hypothetical protein
MLYENKKGALLRDALLYLSESKLDLLDVRRLGAFIALGHIEADAIAFAESFETRALDLRKMDKNVRTVILLDKSKTLSFVEPLYCTFCHLETPSLPVWKMFCCAHSPA